MRFLFFYIIATLVSCASIIAQNVVVQDDTLKTTTVTAVAKPSPARESVPVQVMDKDDFDLLGIKELHEAVKRFSGVQIKDYGGIGGVKTVSIRSFGAQHTAISYDGVTVSNAQSGQVDIGRFNLDNVNLVTLSIGPSDDIFQTARMYASAGSLNIRTSEPVFESSNVNVGASVKISSFNTYNPALNYQHRLSSRWALSVNADWLKSDGVYPFTLVNGTEVTREERLNSDVNTIKGEANVYGDFGGGGKIVFKGNYLNSERGLPGSVTLYNPDARERLWDEAAFAQVSYHNSLGGRWELRGQLKYNYAWNKYRDEKEYYKDGVQIDYYTQREYYGSISTRYKPFNGLSFVLSTDLFKNTLDASYENFVYPERYTSLTALAGQFTNGRVTATASILSTFITENLMVGEAADDRFRLSPAVSISYKLLDDKDLRVRASYQDIFRTPTFNDLYYERVGTRSLNPEIARQFNVGATYRDAYDGVVDELSVQTDFYYNKVEDKIVALPTLFVWKMINLGEVDILGADVNVGCALSFGRGMRLNLQGSYSYQYAVDVTNESDKNYKDQIPYTPKHSGSLSLSLQNRWMNVGYMVSAVGQRYSLPQNTEWNLMDSYTEHSASVSRSFDFESCRLQLQLECLNFTDVQYEVIQYYPMPGRSLRFTIKFDY